MSRGRRITLITHEGAVSSDRFLSILQNMRRIFHRLHSYFSRKLHKVPLLQNMRRIFHRLHSYFSRKLHKLPEDRLEPSGSTDGVVLTDVQDDFATSSFNSFL